MKKLLELPVLNNPDLVQIIKHFMGVTLSSGFGYFILSIILGSLLGDTWKYIQPVEKYYVTQFVLLILGIVLGVYLRHLANKYKIFFYHIFKIDKFLYPIGFTISYLVINEIFGM